MYKGIQAYYVLCFKPALQYTVFEQVKAALLVSRKEKKLSAKKEFSKIDLNGDQALSKQELRKFVESNEELWSVLGSNLGLNQATCIRIATEVAFSLAKGEDSPKKRKSKSTSAEVGNPRFDGSRESIRSSGRTSYNAWCGDEVCGSFLASSNVLWLVSLCLRRFSNIFPLFYYLSVNKIQSQSECWASCRT